MKQSPLVGNAAGLDVSVLDTFSAASLLSLYRLHQLSHMFGMRLSGPSSLPFRRSLMGTETCETYSIYCQESTPQL